MLNLDPDKVCFVIVKTRGFETMESPIEQVYEPEPAEDSFRRVDSEEGTDSSFDEVKALIDELNWDQQCELVALAWIGRGDYGRDDWDDALKTANERHNERTAEYLLGMPLLADYLEEGLAQFDLGCADFEMGHL